MSMVKHLRELARNDDANYPLLEHAANRLEYLDARVGEIEVELGMAQGHIKLVEEACAIQAKHAREEMATLQEQIRAATNTLISSVNSIAGTSIDPISEEPTEPTEPEEETEGVAELDFDPFTDPVDRPADTPLDLSIKHVVSDPETVLVLNQAGYDTVGVIVPMTAFDLLTIVGMSRDRLNGVLADLVDYELHLAMSGAEMDEYRKERD